MNMRVACRTGGVGAALLLACSAPQVASGNPQAEIAAMLERSAADWNHGDLAGFMGDYAKDSLTSYVSGGHVQYGWQKLYDRYQTTYFAPGKLRDSLTFDEVRVRPLTLDLALCTARFALRRGDRERTVHAPPPEAWKSVADSARPHVVGSQVTHRVSRITHPGLLLLVTLAGCSASSDGLIALEGATLIDGSGGEPIKDALVLVQHGHIQAVARVNEIRVPRGAQVVNLISKTIIPGLIDAHAHVERWATQRYLAWGVTTVRDLHGATDTALALRSQMNLGSILGPRMFTAGAMIDGVPPTYPNATGVSTPDEARRAADQH